MTTDRRKFLSTSIAAVGGLAVGGQAIAQPDAERKHRLQIVTFSADITPPLGEPLAFTCPPNMFVEQPLQAKGVVLRSASGTYVLCAMDWCVIAGSTYDFIREKIAKAAGGIPASQVAVHTLHQHTAPCYNTDAQQMLNRLQGDPLQNGLEFVDVAAGHIADAVTKAMTGEWRNVTDVGTGWASVDEVASSRRILQPDGRILARLSSTNVPEEQKAPEGYIDAYVRTVVLFDSEEPVARMYYYATHPQSYYWDGRVSYDVPGIARERIEKESGFFQVYFTGCGGDIAMGKYNDGTHGRRPILVDRLYDGMTRSIRNLKKEPVLGTQWKITEVQFPARNDGSFSEQACRDVLSNPKAPYGSRLKAAWARVRASNNHPIQLSCLSLGSVRILHLPGEPFVEYQLWAQRNSRGLFVAVAGYGDDATGYICTNDAYSSRGGYEQTESFVGPSEDILKEAIGKLLSDQ